MEFFNWTTDYQLYRKQTPKKEQEEYPAFFRRRLHDLKSTGVVPIRLMSEDYWKKQGKPYYNIHPKMVSKLCKVDLTKIPSPLFQMPHGQQIVNIRFAQQHPEFTVTDKMISDNHCVTGERVGVMPAGSFCHSILMMDGFAGDLPETPRTILFIMDFDVYTKHHQPVYSIMGLYPDENKTLEDLLNKRESRYGNSYDAMMANIMRLAVSIGFLSDNPSICEHDILSKDRSNFDGGSEDQRQTIIERAKRRGKNGYNVGNDLMFLGERPEGESRFGESTGRELQYAHIRGGHPHAVRYGPGKKFVKIKWFAPTTVRDDLPFKD